MGFIRVVLVASRLTLVEYTIKTRALRYVYSVSDPECFGGRLVTLVEYTEFQTEIARVVPVARLIHNQRPSWGIPLFLMLVFVYQTAPDSEWLGNRSLTLMECTVGYATNDLFV